MKINSWEDCPLKHTIWWLNETNSKHRKTNVKDRVLIKRFFEYTKFEKLSELIDGKKIHNCSEYRTTTTKTFTRICDSPGILWGQLSVLVHEPYKRRKKKALNQGGHVPAENWVSACTTIHKHNWAHN